MGTYVYFKAVSGQEDSLNAKFAAMMSDPEEYLVYSQRIIEAEIAHIHSPKGKDLAHLRSRIKTLNDWMNVFPGRHPGDGKIKISGSIKDDERWARNQVVLDFLLANRASFESVDGLEAAQTRGYKVS